MIRPDDLESDEGRGIWETLAASANGDVAALRLLLDRNPRLSRAQYWYLPAVHFAAREGHAEAVQLLLDVGADPEWNGLHDGSLIDMARDRGHRKLCDFSRALGTVPRRVVAHPSITPFTPPQHEAT
jgi:hypothetical protein